MPIPSDVSHDPIEVVEVGEFDGDPAAPAAGFDDDASSKDIGEQHLRFQNPGRSLFLRVATGDGSVAELSLGEDQDFGALVSRLFPVSNGNATSAGSVQELWRRAQSLPAGSSCT